jgi:predicted Zn-dependent protease
MTLPRQPRAEIPVQVEHAKPTAREIAKESVQPVEAPRPAAVEVAPRTTGTSLEGDALRADLKAELNRLHHLMCAFDATYEQLKKGGAIGPQAKVITDDKAGDKKLSEASKKVAPVRDSGEAPLIEEIKSSKRKPKLVSPKVAEQGEIIDQFIKVAPTLPRTQPTETTTDLSEESVNYGDNIVSETLVEILLKQGKKAKAIEMLKKLIWKFPQKKAYFAAQIDALKG